MNVTSGDRTLKKFGLQLTGVTAFILFLTLLSDTPSVAQDGPVARITLPSRGQTLSGNVTVQGTATSPTFARFTVSYALEPDLASWTEINGVLQPQENGMLAVWNTRPIADGKYALRLQIVNNDGTTTETIVRELTIANAQTTTGTNAETGTPVSDTAALTSTSGTTNTLNSLTGIDTSSLNSLNLSDLPRSFIKGARYALYAFIALGAYLLLKKLIGLLINRLSNKPIDYGR
jgi:hypothetical protein